MASSTGTPTTAFEVYVSKDTFKFNAAHFVAFSGYRERLHGHNYLVGVRLLGQRKIGADGYVIDFGCIKATCKAVCKRLNENFLCPMHSNVMKIDDSQADSVRIECEDSSVFVFPRNDCAMLPIVHATTEELAIYLWGEILKGLQADYLIKRNIHTMEVTVAEAPGQEATFRWSIPTDTDGDFQLDVLSFIQEGKVIPMPCPAEDKSNKPIQACCPDCQGSKTDFSAQLEQIAKAINNGSMNGKEISAKDLEEIVNKSI
jgi:6-pyruvoyl-tetrahydropterin synthase